MWGRRCGGYGTISPTMSSPSSVSPVTVLAPAVIVPGLLIGNQWPDNSVDSLYWGGAYCTTHNNHIIIIIDNTSLSLTNLASSRIVISHITGWGAMFSYHRHGVQCSRTTGCNVLVPQTRGAMFSYHRHGVQCSRTTDTVCNVLVPQTRKCERCTCLSLRCSCEADASKNSQTEYLLYCGWKISFLTHGYPKIEIHLRNSVHNTQRDRASRPWWCVAALRTLGQSSWWNNHHFLMDRLPLPRH